MGSSIVNRNIPEMQEVNITIQKGLSFTKAFRIINAIGEEFDFKDEEIVGFLKKDNPSCPKIPFCVGLLNCASSIEMFLDVRMTETMGTRFPYRYEILLNPRPNLDDIDRPLTIMDTEYLQIDPNLPFSTYTSYRDLEPLLPHKNSYRLVKGFIKVED